MSSKERFRLDDKTHFNLAGVKLLKEGDMVWKTQERRGPYEKPCLEMWDELCLSNGTMIDVGSYNGLYALIAATRGCRAIAFEPNPVMAHRIIDNARLNVVAVEVHNYALWKEHGTKDILIPHTMSSGTSFFRPNGTPLTVCTRKLDDFHFENVKAIKLDAERAEADILNASMETITKSKPVLIVETLSPESVDTINKLLWPLRYKHLELLRHMSVWRHHA